MRYIDISGHKFGRLTVVAYSHGQRAMWRCSCECGSSCIVSGKNLRRGETKSCGCLRFVSRATHGHTRKHQLTPTYQSWRSMRYRRHKDYGARGITVCVRWQGRDGFANFVADMGERPAGMFLERKDNNGNYEPGNCRWATRGEQAANRRTSVLLTHAGETLCLTQWARRLGLTPTGLRGRLDRLSVEEALSTPRMGA